jgi:hypothetical protein
MNKVKAMFLEKAKTYEEIRHIYKEFLEESGYKLA